MATTPTRFWISNLDIFLFVLLLVLICCIHLCPGSVENKNFEKFAKMEDHVKVLMAVPLVLVQATDATENLYKYKYFLNMAPDYYMENHVKVFMAVPLVPVQATDATENDLNRPLVTSSNSEITEASDFPLPNLCYPSDPQISQGHFQSTVRTYRDNVAEPQQRNETATSHGLNIQDQQTRARIVPHPDRATMRQRLDTFTGWPHTNSQPPQRLAEAGLFYTGKNDLCRCFTCDGVFKRWNKGDDPWLEHARWFPHCTYVREVKGQDYINLVLAAAEQAMRENEAQLADDGNRRRAESRHNPQMQPYSVQHPDRATISQRLDTFSNWPHTRGPSQRSLAEAGLFYTGSNDRCVCFSCGGGLLKWEDDDDAWSGHASIYPECQFVRQQKGQDYIDRVMAVETALTSETAKHVMSLGFAKAAVRRAIHNFMKRNGSAKRFTVADLTNILLEETDL